MDEHKDTTCRASAADARSQQPIDDPPFEQLVDTRSPWMAVMAMAAEHLPADQQSEWGHTKQVTRLSLRLFDELTDLHGLGPEERFYLQCAAMLHDIGVLETDRAHHKAALHIIRSSEQLPLDDRQKNIIASVARYHRRAVPSADKHDHFASLDDDDRQIVSKLAAILRVGDALDRTHTNVVDSITCRVSDNEVLVCCTVGLGAVEEKQAVQKKADLFEDVFQRTVTIQTRLRPLNSQP